MGFLAASPALFSAYAETDFFGKCIFLSLFLVSIACWVVLVYKVTQLKRIQKLTLSFEKVLQKHQGQLLQISADQMPIFGMRHPFARIFQSFKQKTIELLKKNHFFSDNKEGSFLTKSDLELLESHVFITISSSVKELEKHLYVLSTIQALAPFLGLLGTVWGILLTFGGWQEGVSATSNAAVLGGLATALVTTVLGLVIAIPALISHNYLKNMSKTLTSDMEDFLYSLLSGVELQYRRPV